MKKFASDIFNLSGKITEKHAKEIDEILESLLSRANTAGALKMFDYISKDQGWKYTKKECQDAVDKVSRTKK